MRQYSDESRFKARNVGVGLNTAPVIGLACGVAQQHALQAEGPGMHVGKRFIKRQPKRLPVPTVKAPANIRPRDPIAQNCEITLFQTKPISYRSNIQKIKNFAYAKPGLRHG